MQIRFSLISVLVLLVFFACPHPITGQVVLNPGFEDQSTPVWTTTGTAATNIDISPFPNMNPNPAQFWSAYVQANSTGNTISQSISFTSTGPFQISFLSAIMNWDTGSPAPQLNVSLSGGLYNENFTVSEITPDPSRAYSLYTGSVFNVTSVGNYTLTFAPSVAGSGDDIWIDNVQITAVPEPTSVLLLGSSLIVLGIRHRRRLVKIV